MPRGHELATREALVPVTPSECLADQYYAWEKRGRGWQVWPYPVELEPAFEPFLFHSVPAPPIADDARKPTLLGSLIGRLRARVLPPGTVLQPEPYPVLDYGSLQPAIFEPPDRLVELQISIPADLKVSKASAEQFLLSLTCSEYPAVFEVVASS